MIAEFYLDELYAHGLRVVRYEPLPRYPGVERDFSFVFDDGVAFEEIHRTVIGLGLAELRSFVPVEIFRGGNVPGGKYSLLLRARFQSSARTLREDEIAKWSEQIVEALQDLGGKLRT
jgi:phenylalanyl-tRNA synthetase beta chain